MIRVPVFPTQRSRKFLTIIAFPVIVVAVAVLAASAGRAVGAGFRLQSKKSQIVTFQPDVPAAERRRIVEASDGTVVRELYDLESDPYETHNIAGDEAHAATVAELSAMLKEGWEGALPINA